MSNFQGAIQDGVDVRARRISLGPSRREKSEEYISKLRGEIKDASQGLNMIESRCVVSKAGEGQGGAFIGHEVDKHAFEED